VGRLGADVDVLDLAEVGLGALELERVPELVLGGDVQGPLGERPDIRVTSKINDSKLKVSKSTSISTQIISWRSWSKAWTKMR